MTVSNDTTEQVSTQLRMVPARVCVGGVLMAVVAFFMGLVAAILATAVADSLASGLMLFAFVGVPVLTVVGIVLGLGCVVTLSRDRPGRLRKTIHLGWRFVVSRTDYACDRIAWHQEASYSDASDGGGYTRNITVYAVSSDGDRRVVLNSVETWLLGFRFERGRGILLRGRKPLPPVLTFDDHT